jgi:hypothetical protein
MLPGSGYRFLSAFGGDVFNGDDVLLAFDGDAEFLLHRGFSRKSLKVKGDEFLMRRTRRV